MKTRKTAAVSLVADVPSIQTIVTFDDVLKAARDAASEPPVPLGSDAARYALAICRYRTGGLRVGDQE